MGKESLMVGYSGEMERIRAMSIAGWLRSGLRVESTWRALCQSTRRCSHRNGSFSAVLAVLRPTFGHKTSRATGIGSYLVTLESRQLEKSSLDLMLMNYFISSTNIYWTPNMCQALFQSWRCITTQNRCDGNNTSNWAFTPHRVIHIQLDPSILTIIQGFISCYELNSCWSPTPQCDGIWRWALWEVMKFR